ncbi:MAG: murein biosynthesis integral membrane protein MurJ [Planctomycetota bacterium]|nr:murein biosynthesis integral membrane protein MurJ [Planctomycetota bacterium]
MTPPPQSSGLFARLRLVSSITLASRILGLVRDMAMAAAFGNGAVLDAFTVAFRGPNLARRLFGEGALVTAFLPVFIREMEHNGPQSAWRITSAVFCVLAMSLTGMVIVLELLLLIVVRFWTGSPEGLLLFGLTATMLPYLILICLAAQVSAVLNAMDHFKWPALLPVLLNVVWIVGVWFATGWFESQVTQVYVVACCVLCGGVLQLAAGVPTLRRLGFRFDSTWRDAMRHVKEILIAMLPVLVGLSITQLNGVVDSLTAWGFSAPESSVANNAADFPLESGTASALYFGQRLFQFPLGVFAVALGTVLFPLLTRHAERGEMQRVREDLSLGLCLVMAIGVPASVGLVLLSEPLTVLLFERGEFNNDDSRQTAKMIAAYGISIWASCALLIIQRGYYAVGDRITPMKVGIAGLLINVVLNFVLMYPLGGVGLAYASSISGIVQAISLTWLVQNRIGGLEWKRIGISISKSCVAAAAMSGACWWTTARITASASLGGIASDVVIPFAASVATYFAAARIMGLTEPWMLLRREVSPEADSVSKIGNRQTDADDH